ncbi:MAG: M1 family aminopeptidase [Bacteroidota bacterium]
MAQHNHEHHRSEKRSVRLRQKRKRRRRKNGGWKTALLLTLALLLAACDRDPQALPPQEGMDVHSYEVFLNVDPGAQVVRGLSRIVVGEASGHDTLRVRFDDERAVRSVQVDGSEVGVTYQAGHLYVPFPRGSSFIDVEYLLEGPQDGLFYEDAEGQAVVFTDSQFLRGASWLPAVHHPADPATLILEVTAPDTFEVVASGRSWPASPVSVSDHEQRWTFELDAAVPVYTFAFAVGAFATTEQSVTLPSGATVPIRHHLLGADTTDARWLVRTPETLAYFDATLGPYAFDTYATAQVPIPFAGMENAATSFLRHDLYGETYRSHNVIRNIVEEVNVHEVAHMWFGNRVTIRDYADLWLSEGIVSYLTTMFYEAADGPDMARELRVRMADFASSNDLYDARQPLVLDTVEDPMDLVGRTVYLKGGCVTHLLRLTLGDDAFVRALRRTYAEYGLDQRPLSTVAFQTLLEDEAERDLDAFFDYWVYGTQIPTLRTGWDNTTGLLTWTVEDDAGLLDGLATELQILQEGATQAVALADGQVTLTGERPPTIRPVGVPMRIR